MTEIRLITLGDVRVWVGDEDKTSALPAKIIALMIYLARSGAPRSRAHLAELLWSHRSASNAYGNLRTALSKTRPILGDALIIDAQNIQCQASCDANDFEHFARDESTYARALQLYQGDFMASFFVDDVNDFEAWQRQQSQYLHERFLSIASHHIHNLIAQNAFDTAIQQTQQALKLAPYHEEFHRHLIDVYHRMGQRIRALQQYEICRHTLWEEFGVEPGEKTQALRHSLEHPDTVVSVETHINAPMSSFIGRSETVSELIQSIRQHRFITIVATGGAGKTRLALEVAHRLKSAFRDGVAFIDLSKVAHAEDVPLLVARALTVSASSDLHQSIINHISNREMLLILDNFEHVLEASSLVSQWLQNARQVKILVTSRQALKLYGECVFQVHPLTLQESCQLFFERVRLIHHDFLRTPENDASIRAICQRLDGLPLAIELAATRTHTMTFDEILQGLSQPLSLLVSDLQDIPQRQRTLFHAIDWSYQRLNRQEARLFRSLAVFRGGWTREAVQHISPHGDELAKLVEKSLVRRAFFGTQRYTMLETIREYAHEQLTRHDELTQAQDAHAHWIEDMAQRLADDFQTQKHRQAIRQYQEDEENIIIALDYLASRPALITTYASIIANLGWVWHIQQIFDMPFKHTLNALQQTDNLPPILYARLLLAGGHAADLLGRHQLADEWQQKARQIFEDEGEHVQTHYARFALSSRYDDQNKIIEELETIHDFALEHDAPFLLAITDINLGGKLQERGQSQSAHRILQEGLNISEQYQYETLIGIYYINLANVLQTRGDIQGAFSRLERTLAMTSSNLLTRSHVLFELCALSYVKRQWHDAQDYLYEAEQLLRGTSIPHITIRLHFWRAVLAFERDDGTTFYENIRQIFAIIYHNSANTLPYKIHTVLYLMYVLVMCNAPDGVPQLLRQHDTYRQVQNMVLTPFEQQWYQAICTHLGATYLPTTDDDTPEIDVILRNTQRAFEHFKENHP